MHGLSVFGIIGDPLVEVEVFIASHEFHIVQLFWTVTHIEIASGIRYIELFTEDQAVSYIFSIQGEWQTVKLRGVFDRK